VHEQPEALHAAIGGARTGEHQDARGLVDRHSDCAERHGQRLAGVVCDDPGCHVGVEPEQVRDPNPDIDRVARQGCMLDRVQHELRSRDLRLTGGQAALGAFRSKSIENRRARRGVEVEEEGRKPGGFDVAPASESCREVRHLGNGRRQEQDGLSVEPSSRVVGERIGDERVAFPGQESRQVLVEVRPLGDRGTGHRAAIGRQRPQIVPGEKRGRRDHGLGDLRLACDQLIDDGARREGAGPELAGHDEPRILVDLIDEVPGELGKARHVALGGLAGLDEKIREDAQQGRPHVEALGPREREQAF
jgi:hypothetical protein